MSTIVWKELPEINRKLGFIVGYVSQGVGLGCHCGTMSSITASTCSPCSATPRLPYIQAIKDSEKDPVVTVRITEGTYKGYYVLSEGELLRINQHLNENRITFNNFSQELCQSLASSCGNTPIWVISDVINYRSPARHSGSSRYSDNGEVDEIFKIETASRTLIGRTCDFAEYLIRNKIGYVMESPIIQNPAHKMWGGYSLNRVWCWIPPDHLRRAAGSGYQYGLEKIPRIEDWKKTVFEDLSKSSEATGQYVSKRIDPSITEETVFKVVFDDGVLPDDTRFTRTT